MVVLQGLEIWRLALIFFLLFAIEVQQKFIVF
jgi:hypothetical protein